MYGLNTLYDDQKLIYILFIIMGNCNSVEDIEEIELDEFRPLPFIKPFKYKNLKTKMDYKFKNNIYWIYFNEYHFQNEFTGKP